MHELFLVGQVPRRRAEQVLNVLAGLTASQPARQIEQHVIYRPLGKAPVPEGAKGGTQAITSNKNAVGTTAGKELFLVRLVKPLREKDFGSGPVTAEEARRGWSLVFWDIPEPAQKRAILRSVSDTLVDSDKSLNDFIDLINYK